MNKIKKDITNLKNENGLLYSLEPISNFYSSLSIINRISNDISSNPIIVKDSKGNLNEKNSRFYYFLVAPGVVKIPKKVEYVLNNFVSIKQLETIHPDKDTAIEYCLLFLSFLIKAYPYINGLEETSDKRLKEGWINLKAVYLQEVFNYTNLTYKKIIKVLEEGSKKKGPIIECDYSCQNGIKSYSYRLSDVYSNKGIVSYRFKVESLRTRLSKDYYNRLYQVTGNTICRNLFKTYSEIDLPSEKELIEEAKRLKKIKYTNKKGKKLTFLGNNSRDKFKGNYSFVEDHVEMFKYLTEDGYMLPVIGDEKSGGRIIDSFTLMPSWIRKMIKIDNKPMVEVDYVALHPNIAAKIYEGTSEFITHEKIANSLNINIQDVKIEHLSFFNKRVEDMQKSILWEYYIKNDPQMLLNIVEDKQTNGYKTTSKRLFKAEVDIMTEVVECLNKQGIFVGYVYDALFCKNTDRSKVIKVMNQIIVEQGLKTIAK